MPTQFALEREGPWWNAETMSPTMQVLAEALRLFYGVGANAIGAKGDNADGHMQGAHRSRAWIRNSAYCTNRSYTVSETEGNRVGGDDDWLAGMDITIPHEQLLAACQRLDAAVRAGRLEKITEWYGNTNGDQRVDGYDNIRNTLATSDSSHLWHLHITFDRGGVGQDHADVHAVLTGQEVADDMQQFTIARDDKTKQLYLCGWMESRPIAEADIPNLETLDKEGHLKLWRGANGERIREGWYPGAYGPVRTSSGTGGGATADEVRAIVDEELDEQSLGGADKD